MVGEVQSDLMVHRSDILLEGFWLQEGEDCSPQPPVIFAAHLEQIPLAEQPPHRRWLLVGERLLVAAEYEFVVCLARYKYRPLSEYVHFRNRAVFSGPFLEPLLAFISSHRLQELQGLPDYRNSHRPRWDPSLPDPLLLRHQKNQRHKR